MKKWQLLVGERYNDLTLLTVEKIGYRYRAIVECTCGEIDVKELWDVTTGKVKSCGCKRAENISIGKTVHGYSKSSVNGESTEYVSWRAMKSRCTDPNNRSFKDYGGRKIRISRRWVDSFQNFLEDMGMKPDPSYTIERVNNDWVTFPLIASGCLKVSKRRISDPEGVSTRSNHYPIDIIGMKC